MGFTGWHLLVLLAVLLVVVAVAVGVVVAIVLIVRAATGGRGRDERIAARAAEIVEERRRAE